MKKTSVLLARFPFLKGKATSSAVWNSQEGPDDPPSPGGDNPTPPKPPEPTDN